MLSVNWCGVQTGIVLTRKQGESNTKSPGHGGDGMVWGYFNQRQQQSPLPSLCFPSARGGRQSTAPEIIAMCRNIKTRYLIDIGDVNR